MGGHEDYELVCRFAAKGFDAVVLHNIGCVYRQTPTSMTRKIDFMQGHRRLVWLQYVKEVLGQDCSPELLVHLIGGYTSRLRCGDYRYDIVWILNRILGKISPLGRNFSQATTVLLARKLTELIEQVSNLKSIMEQRQREKCIYIIEKLTDIVLDKITNEPFLKESPLMTLLELAGSQLRINQIACSRKILRHASSISPPIYPFKAGIAVLQFLLIILPGKLALIVWMCIRNIYEILFIGR